MKLWQKICVIVILATGLSVQASHPALGQSPVITINPAITYQTVIGWEATTQSGEVECTSFSKYKDNLFDQAIGDLGINRVRLEIRSGAENPVDYFAQLLNGSINYTTWKSHWYEIINDNSNPNSVNANGFKFTELDYSIDNVVLPLKQRLEANGEKLYINLNVVDFNTNQGASNTHYQSQPNEYGELVLATFQHIQTKYGWAPDAIEIILEPDVAGWNGTSVGNALVAAANRLKAQGFDPEFIAPSNTDMGSAISYFDQLIAVPGALTHIAELSYHRYSGVSDQNLQAIGNRAVQYGIRTGMLEHIGSGYEDLHKDLKIARNSAWQQFALGYCSGTNDGGGAYFVIDQSNLNNPVVNMGSRTKLLRQYFKFIRAGAVRIDAASNNGTFDPLAFINTNGGYVVVVKASAVGSFRVQGLPAGTYGRKYTTGGQYDVDLPDVNISAGQAVNAAIPAAGVLTVYAKTTTTSPGSTTLSLNLTARDINGGQPESGDTIVYTIDVRNTGSNPALDVTVTDNLPDQVSCQAVSGPSAPACADPLTWIIPTLSPTGLGATLRITTSIKAGVAGQTIINTASVQASNVPNPPADPVPVCPDGSLFVGSCLRQAVYIPVIFRP